MKNWNEKKKPGLRLDKYLRKFESAFKCEVIEKLLQKRFMDHEIYGEKEAKPFHHRLTQTSACKAENCLKIPKEPA